MRLIDRVGMRGALPTAAACMAAMGGVGTVPVVDGDPDGDMDGSVDGDVEGNVLRVTRSCTIRISELAWRFSASGGPGGQHANTANTRVEVVFDVAGSPSLGPRQRARLLERLGPEVRVVAADERSQARNRALALDRLRSRLAAALKVERPRRPTTPTAASKRRRVEQKRRRSDKKRLRRPVQLDE